MPLGHSARRSLIAIAAVVSTVVAAGCSAVPPASRLIPRTADIRTQTKPDRGVIPARAERDEASGTQKNVLDTFEEVSPLPPALERQPSPGELPPSLSEGSTLDDPFRPEMPTRDAAVRRAEARTVSDEDGTPFPDETDTLTSNRSLLPPAKPEPEPEPKSTPEPTAKPEPAPTPEPIKPAEEPVNPAPEPIKPAEEPANPAPEPIKTADESIKPAPEPVKVAPEPIKTPAEPITAPTEAASSEDIWREGVQSLRAVARGRLKGSREEQKPGSPNWTVRDRLLGWLAEPDLDPDARTAVDVAQSRAVFKGLAAVIDPSTPTATRGAEIRDAVATLEAQAPLEITELKLCRKVNGFGNIEPLEPPSRKVGQAVVLYCELTGLAYEPTGPSFRSRVSAQVELIADGSETAVWTHSLGTAEDACRRRRRDFFVGHMFTLPESVVEGKYRMRLTEKDLVTDHVATRETTINVVK
jgi:hypothetical protein